MKKISTIFVAFFYVFLGETANACSIAPDYLVSELGAISFISGDLFSEASQIAIGKFDKPDSSQALFFLVSDHLKPFIELDSEKRIELSFLEVRQDRIFFYPGTTENAFDSIYDVSEYIRKLTSKSSLENRRDKPSGFGGLLAGIYHGVDCSRTVSINKDQKYLVALDSENNILAKLPIKRSIQNNAPLISELRSGKSLNEIFTE